MKTLGRFRLVVLLLLSVAALSLASAAPAHAQACAPAWAAGINYAVGTQVSYASRNYQVLQAHTSQAGWEPPNAAALFQDLGACTSGATATATRTATATATGTATPTTGGTVCGIGGTCEAETATLG